MIYFLLIYFILFFLDESFNFSLILYIIITLAKRQLLFNNNDEKEIHFYIINYYE